MTKGSRVKRSKTIRVRLTPSEQAEVVAMAKETRLSVSELVRRLVMDYRLPPPVDPNTFNALVKANGDMARLGNLLKMMLDQNRSSSQEWQRQKWHQLYQEIDQSRLEVRRRVQELA